MYNHTKFEKCDKFENALENYLFLEIRDIRICFRDNAKLININVKNLLKFVILSVITV